jgi:UDP:flavonoid glycosyltransferase YjiC (YdhE family)
MAKVIVSAPPIPGEFAPLLQLARGLAARGHQITVLGGSFIRSAVEEAGLAFEPLTGGADYDIRELVVQREAAGLAPGPEQLNFDWTNAFVNPMPDEHAALQRLLSKDPDQHLICNALFLGAWPVRCGVPGLSPRSWVSVSAVPLALSSDDTTFFGPVPVGPGEDAKAANRAANDGFKAALRPTDDRLEEVLAGMGAGRPSASFVDAIYTIADAGAVLTVPGFDFPRSDLPENVHRVGVLPAPGADGWQPPAWWDELDGSRPVVLVTQGTVANVDLSQLIEPTLLGLADRDVTVIAALGCDPEALLIEVPGNAHAVEYVPFGALLTKTDVFVTNGGFGGTQQALAAGVPVVVAGETEDKPATAARVAYHRLGVNLGTATPTAQAVADAVDGLVKGADPEVRDNVQRLAKEYAQYDVIDNLERLLLG